MGDVDTVARNVGAHDLGRLDLGINDLDPVAECQRELGEGFRNVAQRELTGCVRTVTNWGATSR